MTILAPLAAVWCAVAALELFLDLVCGDGALRSGPLPPATRLWLIAHQLALLGASVVALGLPLPLLARLEARLPARVGRVLDGVLLVSVSGALLLYAASWGVFWHAGQFLNSEALALAARNSVLFPWTAPAYLLGW